VIQSVARLTVDGPVKFSADTHQVLYRGKDGGKYDRFYHDMVLIDDGGKRHHLNILRKVRIRPPDPVFPVRHW